MSRCWSHRNAHLHTQLTGGQHLHHPSCSEVFLATASPPLLPCLQHFPTALPLPQSQLTGHCQLLCHHATTTATQKTLSWLPSLNPTIQSSSPANFSKDEAAKRIAEGQTQGPQAKLTLVL